MIYNKLKALPLFSFLTVVLFVTSFATAQITLPTPTRGTGAPDRTTPTPGDRGVFNGPGGIGQGGEFAPTGGGETGGEAPFAGPGGGGRPGAEPGAEPQPTGGGSTGGSGGSGTPPVTPPGAGIGQPTGPGGTPGAPTGNPRGRRNSGATGALGQNVSETSWQNWWALNQGHYLELERRFHGHNDGRERNPDLFSGDVASSKATFVGGRDALITKQTLPMLQSFLEHKHFAVRAESAIAIGRIGSADQVAWLTPLTKDKNKRVRQAAIIGLGLLQSDRAISMLKYLVKSRRTLIDERSYAAVALGIIGKPELADFFIEQLNNGRRSREIDAAQLYALGLIKSSRSRRFLDYYVSYPLRDSGLRAVALDALALHNDVRSVDTIKKALKDEDVRVRRSAALAIGRVNFSSRYRAEWNELKETLNGDDALEVSSRVLSEYEAYQARLRVKLEADESELTNKKMDLINLIEKVGLRDSDVIVKNFLNISLGELGGERAINLLHEQLIHAKLNSTKAFAALGLAISKDKDAGKFLYGRLKRKRLDQETKAAFYLALGLVDHKEAKALIKKRFKSGGDTAIARYSAISLALLGDDSIKKPLQDRLIQKSRPELKQAYGQALAILGDTEAIVILDKALKRSGSVNHKVQLFAALASVQDARSLETLLRAADPKKRKNLTLAAAVRAIGLVGEKGDEPILADKFRHLNYPLRILTLNQIALL